VQNIENHINAFDIIHQLGANIGINNYGTGYSSLSTLSVLPITTLKLAPEISKNLINTQQLKLAKAYQLSASALDIKIIASAIDTQQQVQQFKRLGYTLGQGRALDIAAPCKLIS
jgi:EAL domain-containing protein (putative c-di-GMP-specific phosphodiesterase class I)